MIYYLSNADFKYLSPADRETLKKDYHNFTVNYNGSYNHYIQDINEYYFKQHLSEVKALHKANFDLYIFMNDSLGRSLGLIKEEELPSQELF